MSQVPPETDEIARACPEVAAVNVNVALRTPVTAS